jgi:hypothetical protein
MQDLSPIAPTRVVVLDLVSLVVLAAAAGIACGIALAGATLLFASQPAGASAAQPDARPMIEQPVERPTGTPGKATGRPAGTMV